MKSSPIDATDKRVIAHQLGRAPRGVEAIVKRCKKGFPQVVLNSPLHLSHIPFPTTYWLTCPLLSKTIARLEEQGQIKHFQKQITEDKKFRQELFKSQQAYCDSRKSMLPSSSRLASRAKEILEETGVGGISDFSKIKCLHAHFAHYLATGLNPVGKKVAESIGEVSCNQECGKK